MPTFINLTGEKFGRLFVLTRAKNIGKRITWNCLCDCGKTVRVRAGALSSGKTQSCGCLQRDITINRSFKHGLRKRGDKNPTYNSWALMKDRCLNANNQRWKDYGGRGIKVCRRWLSFSNFLADMGQRQPGMSLERKNVNRNYCKSNCKWIPQSDQVLNRTDTLRVRIGRRSMPAKTAARLLDVPWRTFTRNVKRYGAKRAVEIAKDL